MASQAGPVSLHGAGAGANHMGQVVSVAVSRTPTLSNNWPVSFNIMLWIALTIYILLVSPSLAKHLASNDWKRGWFLRSKAASVSLKCKSIYTPSRSASRFLAMWRGFYNIVFLPTIPWINLTVAQCFVLLFYLVCVTLATFAQVGSLGDDLNRSGRIAVAQLPVLFILATKNNLLSGFGKTYEKLNFIHRFAGRCVIICGAFHTGYYIKKLSGEGQLHLFGGGVQTTGFVATLATALIFLTSLPPVRKFAYQTFIISHVVGWIGLVVGVYLHCTFARPWVLISLSILGLDYIVRALSTRIRTASLTAIAGLDGFTRISVPNIKSGWRPGQHVWIRRLSLKHGFQIHPFTVASSPELDSLHTNDLQGLTLYAKNCGDFTKGLHEAAYQQHGFEDAEKGVPPAAEIKLSIEGPYGGSWTGVAFPGHFVRHAEASDFESVILVAGGSGITYILALLSDIVASTLSSQCATRHMKVIYVVRELFPATYFMEKLEELVLLTQTRTYFQLDVEIYHTGSEHAHALAGTPHRFSTLNIRQERPDLSLLLSMFLHDIRPSPGASLGGGAMIATCGPRSLIASARNAASSVDRTLAYSVGGVVVHSEMFGW